MRKVITLMILTATLGRITYSGHTETWYDLPMDRVVANAQEAGIPCEYWVRDDGVKMFGQWVIVASHPSVTRHTAGDTELYDIATDWKE